MAYIDTTHSTKSPSNSPKDVNTSIWFLVKNKLYDTVKPYALAFTPDTEIPRENVTREKYDKCVSDIRGRFDELTFARNGFTVLNMPDYPKNFDWDDKLAVERDIYPGIIAELEKAFRGASCIALHHQIRKRDSRFPLSTGKDYTYGQPLLAAHIDTVRSSAEQLVLERLGEQAVSILTKRYLIANVWRPLHGPNDDYPLALCDLTTIDQQKDLEVADYVTPKLSREHCLVYANENHRWWYLSGHKTTEALVFVQYDSEKGTTSGVPHAAFWNPSSQQEKPRQSIEVPVLIWYD